MVRPASRADRSISPNFSGSSFRFTPTCAHSEASVGNGPIHTISSSVGSCPNTISSPESASITPARPA